MKDKHEIERKPYSKPEIRRVELKPEENLSVGCKTVSGPGPVTSCNVSSCFTIGS